MKKFLSLALIVFLYILSLHCDETSYGHDNFYNKNLGLLPILRNRALVRLESSRDKTGNGQDGYANACLYSKNGEKFILDAKGPGKLLRIVILSQFDNEILNFYIDGDKVSYRFTLKELFQNNKKIFPYPLSIYENNNNAFTAFVDIPFEKSLKISSYNLDFYNFEFSVFPMDINIKSWNRNSISNSLIDEFTNGYFPENKIQSISKKFNKIKSKENVEILYFDKKAKFVNLKMKYPLLDQGKIISENLTDNGRWHKGKSKFTFKIDRNYQYLKLKRRINYDYGDMQWAQLFVNGNPYYSWVTKGMDIRYKWIDLDFYLDPSIYWEQKELNFEFKFHEQGNTNIWNEYFYWFYGEDQLLDSLDVGNLESEIKHNYSIENQVTFDTITSKYYIPNNELKLSQKILDSCFIRIYWDNDTTPSVNTKLSHFFGIGSNTIPENKSLMFGIDSNRFLYNKFPMPFYTSARIILDNQSSIDLDSLDFEYYLDENNFDKNEIGYFNAKYENLHSKEGYANMKVLEEKGDGHLVNIILEGKDESDLYLEGNERIYIDSCLTPMIDGTGMEDFFNSGFYFRYDVVKERNFGLADVYGPNKLLYRNFINDPYSFKNNIRFYLQFFNPYHTDITTISTTPFYYLNKNIGSIKSDEFKIGVNSERIDHKYLNNNLNLYKINSSFEGTFSKEIFDLYSTNVVSESSFKMNISPENYGVNLYRILDNSIENQEAEIFVDDNYVGNWRTSGSNSYFKLREDIFLIPENFTKNKSQISIKIKVKNGNKYNEISYKTYSILRKNIINEKFLDVEEIDNIDDAIKIISDINNIEFCKFDIFEIYDIKGNLILKSNSVENENLFKNLTTGIYFLRIKNDNQSKVYKLLKTN